MRSKYAPKKKITDLGIFHSLTVFLKTVYPIIKQIEKDSKMTFGYDILKYSSESISLLRAAYYEKQNKIQCISTLKDKITDIELLVKILFEIKSISVQQVAQFSIHLGDIKNQIETWERSNVKPNQ